MALTTVAGPFTKQEAQDTASQLGNQFSAFGIERKDAEGYGLGVDDWYVEKDDAVTPDKIFGYDAAAFLAQQYK